MSDDVHITEEQIIALATGEMDAAEATRIESALQPVPEAVTLLARLRRLVADLRGDDTRPATAAAMRRAIEAFRPATGAGRAPGMVAAFLEGARRITGRLIFDSHARPALAGFRGGTAVRHLSYKSEAVRLDVQVAAAGGPEEPSWRVRGQIDSGGAVARGAVALVEPATGAPMATGFVDAQGRFTLDVPAGTYNLIVEVDHGQGAFVAPNLRIQ